MEATTRSAKRIILDAALVATAAILIGGAVVVSREFGFVLAVGLSLILALPLVVAVRLRRRSPSARPRELAFLVVLVCAAVGSSAFVTREWYASGFAERHLEDLQWSRFESAFRRDPAYRNLVTEWNHKSRYYVEGEVATEADLERLCKLAKQHNVRWPLDGPFAHSKSLTVRGKIRCQEPYLD